MRKLEILCYFFLYFCCNCARKHKFWHIDILTCFSILMYFLQTNDAFVASLLRLKDNNCHLEESVQILLKKQKYVELIILYEKKEEHRSGLKISIILC